MPFPITGLYAGLAALLLVALSLRVIRARYATRIEIGDGGDAGLTRRIRAQANFVEYVPLALVVIAMAEANGADGRLLHGLGAALIVGRIAHAIGFVAKAGPGVGRAIGMALTYGVLIVGGAVTLAQALGWPAAG